MTWTGDPRTTTPQWRATRKRILTRDHGICHVCRRAGADRVDHKVNVKSGGGDDDRNLAAICLPCDRKKSSAEGNKARWRYPSKRPPERHPGYVD